MLKLKNQVFCILLEISNATDVGKIMRLLWLDIIYLKKKQNQCLDIHDIHPYIFLTLIIVICMARSTRPEVFHKKGVLRSFAKLTGKHLCQNLFINKVASLRPATLLKKRLWHMYFPKRRK